MHSDSGLCIRRIYYTDGKYKQSAVVVVGDGQTRNYLRETARG